MSRPPTGPFRFDRFEINPQSHELRLDGRPVAVEPQVFDLLCHLAAHPGELVTHDDLIASVWGGRIVSDSAISARISAARAAIGDDGQRQRFIRTIPKRGFRFEAPVERVPETGAGTPSEACRDDGGSQSVRFCTSPDGTRIAFATVGTGPPLLRAGHWLTHLEHDWQSPIWRPFLDRLAQRFALTRYDQRGNGLSDWAAEDLSLDRFVDDLAAVADAAGLDRFALYGTSQGAPIAVAYACRHPERVRRLILHGGYRRGRLLRADRAEREQGAAVLTLIRHGWGQPGSAFLKSFAANFIPDGTAEQLDSLSALQRLTTAPEIAVRLREAVDRFDVSDLLGRVACQTLVLHSRNDGVQPLDQGRKLAAGIPGAEFALLESMNHVILPQEPAWTSFFERVERFLEPA